MVDRAIDQQVALGEAYLEQARSTKRQLDNGQLSMNGAPATPEQERATGAKLKAELDDLQEPRKRIHREVGALVVAGISKPH